MNAYDFALCVELHECAEPYLSVIQKQKNLYYYKYRSKTRCYFPDDFNEEILQIIASYN